MQVFLSRLDTGTICSIKHMIGRQTIFQTGESYGFYW